MWVKLNDVNLTHYTRLHTMLIKQGRPCRRLFGFYLTLFLNCITNKYNTIIAIKK